MPAIAIPRSSLITASACLLAGAVLFLASAAQAAPRGGHDDHRQRYRQSDRHGGYYNNHHHHRSHSRSNFSLSIVQGYPYRYAYPANYYYQPAPVIVAPPTYYPSTPVNYTSPPSVYNDGRYCREYTQDVWVGGRMQQSYGRACLQPDGAWQIDS